MCLKIINKCNQYLVSILYAPSIGCKFVCWQRNYSQVFSVLSATMYFLSYSWVNKILLLTKWKYQVEEKYFFKDQRLIVLIFFASLPIIKMTGGALLVSAYWGFVLNFGCLHMCSGDSLLVVLPYFHVEHVEHFARWITKVLTHMFIVGCTLDWGTQNFWIYLQGNRAHIL